MELSEDSIINVETTEDSIINVETTEDSIINVEITEDSIINVEITESFTDDDFEGLFALKTTDDLVEGDTNKYFSNALAVNALASHTTDASIHFEQSAISITGSQVSDLTTILSSYITEETDPIYTADKSSIMFIGGNVSDLVNDAGYSDLTSLTSDNLTEGVTNKYFVDALSDGKRYVRKNADWTELLCEFSEGEFTGNVEAGSFTINGVPVGTSSDSYWIKDVDDNISYDLGNILTNKKFQTTNTGADSIKTAGGADIGGNAVVGGTITGNLTGNVTGNSATATKLATARAINGVDFDGTAPITITAEANANTLSGTTLKSTVVNSSLTSVGTLTSLSVNGASTLTGAVSGITTLGLSGAITGATSTNTINGLIINSGALSGISTITASGKIETTSTAEDSIKTAGDIELQNTKAIKYAGASNTTYSRTGVTFPLDAIIRARYGSLFLDSLYGEAGKGVVIRTSNSVGQATNRMLFDDGAGTGTGQAFLYTQLNTTGRILVDDTTEATTTTDGSLQTDGGLSVAKNAVVGGTVKVGAYTLPVTDGLSTQVLVTNGSGVLSWNYFEDPQPIVRFNDQSIDENLTIPANKNGSTVGPITIETGITVTVETGGTWTII